MLLKRIAVSALLGLIIPHTAFADIIVMRNQRRYVGTVANREAFARRPGAASVVSLLLIPSAEDSTAIKRLAAAEIDYVILEDGAEKKVFDLRVMPGNSPRAFSGLSPEPRPDGTPNSGSKVAGAVLVGIGLVASVVGIAVRFGGPQVTATQTSLSVQEKSYNGANYALMIGGGLSLITGIVLVSRPDDQAARLDDSRVLRVALSAQF